MEKRDRNRERKRWNEEEVMRARKERKKYIERRGINMWKGRGKRRGRGRGRER